ncbi:MAG: 50S ribosomal protein L23 [Planctomycetota bacterium]|jgi:large subunit ribosomal protein L23
MEPTSVIHKPLITEKATICSTEQNRVAFRVDPRATKPQIRRAVESLYGVRVLGVATQNRKGQLRRNKFGYWRTARLKIATVKIHPEDRIELF